VHDPNDTLAGHNTITAVQRGCALEEQWQSVRGGTGHSINYYQSGDDRWRQVWIDAGYSVIDISGGLRDGAMVQEGSIHYLNTGKTHPFRGTWTPLEDGRVRQFFQQRDDKGEWQTWFDGFYTWQAAGE
jgi:hypothetical protein